MALQYADRVLETSTTTGTGTYSLAGAVTGFQGFVAGIGNNNSCFYCAYDSDANGVPQGGWEVGLGTVVDASPDTLSRTTILASSNAGAAVNWGAGTRRIFVTDPASHVDLVRSAAYASQPTVGVEGRLFLPTNAYGIERDSGSAWVPWGPLFAFTNPLLAGLSTWVNQGGASVVEDKASIFLRGPVGSTQNLRCRVKAVPTAPYVVTVWYLVSAMTINFQTAALILRQSSDGKIISYGIQTGNSAQQLISQDFNSATSFNATNFTRSFLGGGPLFCLRIEDNNTNRIFSYSMDGQNFIQEFSESRTTFLTPDQIGIYVEDQTNLVEVGMTVLSWKEA